jgi:uncharacterized OsmC-like protein
MSTLREYLAEKRKALLEHRAAAADHPPEPVQLSAHVRAEGRSGIRRIRIRDFQIISDSRPDLAGYDLGPTSPELQLGALGSCLTHLFLIEAADLDIPLDGIEVDVTAQMGPPAGPPGFEQAPVYLRNITYTVRLDSPASNDELVALHAAVEQHCPVLNLLLYPQTITAQVIRAGDEEP